MEMEFGSEIKRFDFSYENKENFLKYIEKFGDDISVIYDKNNIVIIQVKTYKVCNELFNRKNISWCIAEKETYWKRYVVERQSEQYFIIDFNILFNSYNDLIGFTVRNGEIYAAHDRRDYNLLEKDYNYNKTSFELQLRRKGIYKFINRYILKKFDLLFGIKNYFLKKIS